jgi:hypothetical protein
MAFFFGLMSLLVVVAWVAIHPQSFFGLLAIVVLCVGGLFYYLDVEAKKQERIAQREQAEEDEYLKTQRVKVFWAGPDGGCYIDLPWRIETSNPASIRGRVANVTVSVNFSRPNYAAVLGEFSSSSSMKAGNDAVCVRGPTSHKHPAIRVEAVATGTHANDVAKFVSTFEPVTTERKTPGTPMNVGETRTMPDGSTVKRTE